ncbi:MAG: hypothetical protein ABEH77_03490 [Halobacteriaceae archaeon]
MAEAGDAGGPDGTAGPDGPPGDGDGVSRRWLVRLLVGLGIGIPVLVEGATFARLVGNWLFGGEDREGTATATTTTRRGVGVGDELLPDTAPTERVTSATVAAGEEAWRFVLSVEVENDGGVPYELRLGAVTTADGETVAGEATTGRVPPGESAFVTGAWELPPGATPASVAVVAATYGAETERREREVPLARIPVER